MQSATVIKKNKEEFGREKWRNVGKMRKICANHAVIFRSKILGQFEAGGKHIKM